MAKYRQLARSGQQLYGIDTRHSWVQIKVFRGGRLARLGHNHIVSTHLIRGLAAQGPRTGQADLYISLTDLVVDRPDLRRQAGRQFDSRPSANDVAATRANMLGDRVLDAARLPFVELSLEFADGIASTAIKLKQVSVPVDIQISLPRPPSRVPPINGSFNLRLSEFGIEPFTALGGALRVVDEIQVKYQLQLRAATSVEDAIASEQFPES